MKFVHTADWQLGKPFAGISDTHKRSLAQQARIDVIKRIGEQATRTNHDLLVALKGRAPGDRIPLTFEREGIERVVEITLESISER